MHNIADQLAALAELDLLMNQEGLSYWVFGGWAVDFHVGRVTRAHADIDIAIWVNDRARVAALLERAAWQHHPDADEDGYTCYQRKSVRLDIAFLARDEHGAVYTPLNDGRGTWPPDSFGEAVAELNGVHLPVVSRKSLIADKSAVRPGGATAAKDRADVANLTAAP